MLQKYISSLINAMLLPERGGGEIINNSLHNPMPLSDIGKSEGSE